MGKNKTMNFATVFGGGINDRTTPEYAETVLIGKLLADNGYCVVTGGYFGLMEAAAKGAKEAGGQSIGIVCNQVTEKKGNDYSTYVIRHETLCSRLDELTEDIDIFVAQRGSIGTLAEIMVVINLVALTKPEKTKMFVIGDMWKKLLNEIYVTLNVNYDFIIFCDDYADFEVKFNKNINESV